MTTWGCGRAHWLVAAATLFPAVTQAQDTVVVARGRLAARASSVERWAVDLFNAPGTTRAFGPFTLEAGRAVLGDVAVLDGPAVVRGTVSGDLVAINADLTLENGAAVEGNVVVLGGTIVEASGARVGGSLRRHVERVRVRRADDHLELEPRPDRGRPWSARRFYDRERGGASLVLGVGGTYNRVEGLPLRLGAEVEWRSRALDGRVRGFGVFRTAGDFKGNRRDLGYQADARLAAGRHPRVSLGGRVFDLAMPTQDWPLTLHEVGWASFVFHRDYRDYFLQRGVAGFVALEAAPGVTLAGEVARVEETSVAERDPWTPFRNAEAWRPNPVIDEGDFTLITGALEIDTRDDARWYRNGLLARASWEHGAGENLVERPLPPAIRPPLPTADYTFDRVSADLRWYQALGWGGQLRLRGFFAGAVGDGTLPVQRRYSLGGPDPMNGYAFRAIACNTGVTDPAQPGLCDRVLLFQMQYRGGLGFDWLDWSNPRRDRRDRADRPRLKGDWHAWNWDWFDFEGPSLVLFSNAGTAWLAGQEVPSLSWDVGAGVELGSVGLYVAKAIREGEPLRVTFRIERRF